MKATLVLMSMLIAALTLTATAREQKTNDELQVRAIGELKDGSRLVGQPFLKSLPMTLDFMRASIPLEKIRQCDIRHEDGRAVLNFQNGDRLTGSLQLENFKLKTAMGDLSLDIAQINRITFSTLRTGNLPVGEGDILFGGVNWHAWRTKFAIQDDKLTSLPSARPEFNYGHTGSGRGPALVSNIGSADWKDYRIEVDYCVTGNDPAFNPYGLGQDYHNGVILFHIADARENWNQCGSSCYSLRVDGDGGWHLECVYNSYCAVPVGWGNSHQDAQRTLATGSGLKIDRVNGNHYRIEVRGPHIQIWVDGQPVADVTDDQMDKTIGGQTLDHGGVGFAGGFDAMLWIRNFSATQL